MRMSKSAATTALGVLLVVLVSVGTAMAHEGSGPPPKDLKFVNDHWTPWDAPEAAEGAHGREVAFIASSYASIYCSQ